MKVLLVTPIIIGPWRNYCPPLGLGYLKAMLKRNGTDDVRIADLTNSTFEDYRRLLSREKPDVVGITCFTETRSNTLEMLRIAKEQDEGIVTAMGGIHASLMYEQILLNYGFVDVVCLGEGDYVLVELIKSLKAGGDIGSVESIAYLEDGHVVKTGEISQVSNLDELPMPDFEDIDLKVYKGGYDFEKGKPRASIITSRGCPFRCTFCASKQAFGRWRYRSAEKVVDEIGWYVSQGFGHFSFIDDLFTLKQDRIIEICQGIIDRNLNIKWFAQTRADCAKSKEMVKLMKASGCKLLQFGVESGSEEMLKFYNKKEKPEDFCAAFDLCREVGIDTQMSLIVGADGESQKTIAESKSLVGRLRPEYLLVSNLRVFPKTRLMDIAEAKGLLTDDIWLSETRSVYYPGYLSEREVNKFHRELLVHYAKINGIRGWAHLVKKFVQAFWNEPVKYAKIVLGKPFATGKRDIPQAVGS